MDGGEDKGENKKKDKEGGGGICPGYGGEEEFSISIQILTEERDE